MKYRTKEQTLGYLYRAGLFSELITTANSYVEQDPNDIEAWNYLSAGLLRAGYNDAALAVTKKIIAKKPLSPRAYQNHGVVLAQMGKMNQAKDALRIASALQPDDPTISNNLGALLLYQRQIDDAIEVFRDILCRRPSYASAWSNLGVAYTFKDDLEQAATCINNAIKLKPDSHRLTSIRALSLMGLERYEDALSYFVYGMNEQDLKDCDLTNLSYVLNENGLLDDAMDILRKVIEKDPTHVGGWMNLSVTYMEMGEFEKSEEAARKVLSITDAPHEQAYLNLGLALLGQGKLEEGWCYYNMRPFHETLRLPLPVWNGEDLTGKKIVVISDQGIGDEIRWAPMLSELAERAECVKFVGTPKLSSLIQRSIPSCHSCDGKYIVNFEDPDDYYIWLGSLLKFLRPTFDDFVGKGVYLQPDPELARYWQEKVQRATSLPTVGICWRSQHLVGKRKIGYTVLDDWGPIFALRDVTFVNLQYGECEEELRQAEERFGVDILRWESVDLKDDMETAAALTNAVDVVVSAGTAVADLAAALGKPTFLFGPEKSLMTLGQRQVPWYDTVHLTPFGVGRDPEDMLSDVAAQVKQFIADQQRIGAAAPRM